MRAPTLFAAAAIAAMSILPAACSSSTVEPPTQQTQTKNIVQVATDAGTFNTLVTAVKAAGLAATLQGPGPFTVFAPTDSAFAKLPAGTITALLADTAKLRSILTYHVLAGKVTSSDIVKTNGAKPVTVNGQPLDIVVRNGQVFVNGAHVVTADIQASNGVIHVIDAVLLPPAVSSDAGR